MTGPEEKEIVPLLKKMDKLLQEAVSVSFGDLDAVVAEIRASIIHEETTPEQLEGWADRLERIAEATRRGRFQMFDREVTDEPSPENGWGSDNGA
jgi:hypothetical protein